MTAKRNFYIIDVAGRHAGRHTVEVVNDNSEIRTPIRYVGSDRLGVSNPYQVDSDYEAIVRMLTENASPLVNYFKDGDVVKVVGYGFPMQIANLDNSNLEADLYPAWHDEKNVWNSITVGFRLHTKLNEKMERVS